MTKIELEIRRTVAKYHVRNGKKHPDGSLGRIDISPRQLTNILMGMYMVGLLSCQGKEE